MMRVSSLLLIVVFLSTINAAANEFVFKDMQGKEQRLSDYKGKWVLLNFWATWCPPCLEEIPDLVEMHNARNAIDFAVIGIAMSSSRDSVNSFSRQLEISYPVVLGDEKTAAQVGRIDALPTSYLYDPTGKLVSYQSGMVSREAIESYIRSKASKQP
jgi:thiol-disulfide isomerase/thioredoxin